MTYRDLNRALDSLYGDWINYGKYGGPFLKYGSYNKKKRRAREYFTGQGDIPKRVKRLENTIERKYHIKQSVSFTTPAGASNAWGTFVTLNDIAQGDTAETRTGDAVMMQSLTLRGAIYVDAADIALSCLRVFCCIDRKPTDAIADVDDIFTSDGIYGMYTVDRRNAGRFQTLYDKVFQYNHDFAVGEHCQARFFKFHILKEIKLGYDGAGVAQVNYDSNQIIIGACGLIQTAAVEIYYNSKITYLDV